MTNEQFYTRQKYSLYILYIHHHSIITQYNVLHLQNRRTGRGVTDEQRNETTPKKITTNRTNWPLPASRSESGRRARGGEGWSSGGVDHGAMDPLVGRRGGVTDGEEEGPSTASSSGSGEAKGDQAGGAGVSAGSSWQRRCRVEGRLQLTSKGGGGGAGSWAGRRKRIPRRPLAQATARPGRAAGVDEQGRSSSRGQLDLCWTLVRS